MSLSNTIVEISSYNSCDICGHSPLLPHELGWVCEICGTVVEDVQFNKCREIFHDKNQNLTCNHSQLGFGTLIGNKSECKNYFKRLRKIDRNEKANQFNSAHHLFLHYCNIFEFNIPITELMRVYNKVHPQLPKSAHYKNPRILTFGIYLRLMQNKGGVISLKKACRQCDIPVKTVNKLFQALQTTTERKLFCKDELTIGLNFLASKRLKYSLSFADIEIIKKILVSSSGRLGLSPQMQVAKALILFLKAKHLTVFFKRLENENIYDWIDLLKHISDNSWNRKMTVNLRKKLLSEISFEFGVNLSQLYHTYTNMTWKKDRLIIDNKDEIVKCGLLRIPEWCFDEYFELQKRKSKINGVNQKNEDLINIQPNKSIIDEKSPVKIDTKIFVKKEITNEIKIAPKSTTSKLPSLRPPQTPFNNPNKPSTSFHSISIPAISSFTYKMGNYWLNNSYYINMDGIPPPCDCALSGLGPP